MDSRVLLVTRLAPALGVSGVHEGLNVADIRHADAAESAIAERHEAGETVVLTGAASDAGELTELAARARVRIPRLRIAVEPLPGNLLTLTVVSSLADDGGGDSAQLHATLDDLRLRVWSATWLGKLSALREPAPSVWQQIRATLTSAHYLAEQVPAPSVRLASEAPLRELTPRPGTALLHTPSDGWIVEAVRSALAASSASPVVPVRELIDAYDTEHAVEFIAVPEDFRDHARAAADRALECPACGHRHARSSCPVCRMTPSTSLEGVPT